MFLKTNQLKPEIFFPTHLSFWPNMCLDLDLIWPSVAALGFV